VLLAKYEEIIAQGSCPRTTFSFSSIHEKKLKIEEKIRTLDLRVEGGW
jgi:hypothetical protein